MEKWNPFSTVPGNSAVGDTAAQGTDPRPMRADARHGREAYGTPVAATPDAAPSAGTGTDVVRANHQHGFATYTPAPAVVGGAAGSAGTSGFAPSRGDHTHQLGIVTTRGDIIVRDATVPVRLALGANGTVLQSNGTDLVYASSPTPAFVSMAKWYTD